jgi:alpha-L-fucosidase 2
MFVRECFASFPDKVIVMRVSANKPGAINFTARLGSVHPTAKSSTEGDDTLVMTGQVPGVCLPSQRRVDRIARRAMEVPELYDKDGKRKPA